MGKPSSKLRVDRDGVRVYDDPAARRSPSRIALLAAVGLLGGVGAWVVATRPDAGSVPEAANGSLSRAKPQRDVNTETVLTASAPRARRQIRAVHVDRVASGVNDARHVAPRSGAEANEQAENMQRQHEEPEQAELPEIDAREVIEALVAAGETEGIAAFPPPGTNPPKSGIIVPEDFQLPEGYVRHHQTTDDGEALEPILMFSPDYEFLDPSGNPIKVPDDLVVPPDLAPPGLPIRILEVPKRRLR